MSPEMQSSPEMEDMLRYVSRPVAEWIRKDARQEARIGLLEAASRYQEGRGASAVTWARQRCLGAVLDFIRREDPLTRVQRARVQSGEDLPPDKVELDVIWNISEPPAPVEAFADANRLLAALPGRLLSVVRLYYWEGYTYLEISEKLGYSLPRVAQLHAAAIARMRSYARLPAKV